MTVPEHHMSSSTDAPFVHPTAVVEPGASIGAGTKVWSNVQVRPGARVGRTCILGRNSFVDVDVRVGDNVKVQNNASLYEGVDARRRRVHRTARHLHQRQGAAGGQPGRIAEERRRLDARQHASCARARRSAPARSSSPASRSGGGRWSARAPWSPSDVPDHALVRRQPGAGRRVGAARSGHGAPTRTRRERSTERRRPAAGEGAIMIGIAVVGYGYWGPNLVRNFALDDGRARSSPCATSAPIGVAVVEQAVPDGPHLRRRRRDARRRRGRRGRHRHAGHRPTSSWRCERSAPASTCSSRSR